MRHSVIKAKLRRNEPALVTTLHYVDPTLFEMTSLMGFDGIWMDLEHHHYGVETAANLMRAARVGRSDIIARPAKGEFMRMARLLEAGAQGIMYPRCEIRAAGRARCGWRECGCTLLLRAAQTVSPESQRGDTHHRADRIAESAR